MATRVMPFDVGAGSYAAGSGGHFAFLGCDDEHDALSSTTLVYLELLDYRPQDEQELTR
ncbi:hypothetical protein ACWIG5_26860 [Streptomyces lydicus]